MMGLTRTQMTWCGLCALAALAAGLALIPAFSG
ncbi:MAG: hypothetical protein QOE90_1598 [Thermoplasmata archaeon]|jgi:hypothetical protein|nr:hypothetical protein [Thermoplasmata archaeon]